MLMRTQWPRGGISYAALSGNSLTRIMQAVVLTCACGCDNWGACGTECCKDATAVHNVANGININRSWADARTDSA